MTAYPELDAFTARHETVLRELLGPHWPVKPWKVTQHGPLTKYTLGPTDDGRWAMIHGLTEPDAGPAHDHPVHFTSTIIQGSYTEKVYHDGVVATITWKEGSTHEIPPEYIHTITELPEGEVWSLCFAGPVVRAWKHYPELA